MRWIDHALKNYPDRIFLHTASGESLSYRDLHRRVTELGEALRSLRIQPGDRVLGQVEKSPEALVLYLATLWIGAIYVPLNTGYTAAELEYFMTDAEPRLAVVRSSDQELMKGIATAARVPHVETLDADGTGSLLERARSPEIRERAIHSASAWFAGDDSTPAAILYTSGTTGRSKGAILTRGNLVSNAETLARIWRFTEHDVLLHALPIFHVHGLFVAVNTVLASGSAILFLPRFEVDETLRFFPRATCFMGVPTFYTRLLQHRGLTRTAAQSMRLFISGSAPLLAETHQEFAARTGHSILERYGMTETLMITSNPYDAPRVPGTVGLPLPGVEIRIGHPETGELVSGRQEVGMIQVRGPNVFKGYWKNPEKTASEFLSDGYFITGDLGSIDENGYLTIVGRGRDLIISGGYNVYPKEVENELNAVPGVVESAVIGVPHPDFGEGVTAVVVATTASPAPNLEEAALLRSLGDRLAKYKLPKRILFVRELPRNTMGKIQKNLLRDQFRDLYRNS